MNTLYNNGNGGYELINEVIFQPEIGKLSVQPLNPLGCMADCVPLHRQTQTYNPPPIIHTYMYIVAILFHFSSAILNYFFDPGLTWKSLTQAPRAGAIGS